MSRHFNSVEQILSHLETQPGWEKLREHRQLLASWSQVVNQQTAQHTRPLYINRQILYVTTSSSARAQELAFQRYTLLKRLNQQRQLILKINDEIKDIRFSSSGWHQSTDPQDPQAALFTISDRLKTKIHPDPAVALKPANKRSEAGNSGNYLSDTLSSSERAKNAAQRWLQGMEEKIATTLTCPKCNSIISQAELNRWNLCHLCVAQKWSAEYRPAAFPEPE